MTKKACCDVCSTYVPTADARECGNCGGVFCRPDFHTHERPRCEHPRHVRGRMGVSGKPETEDS